MALPTPRRPLRQDLLAREWRVAAPAPVSIATNIAIRVPHVVAILLVEGVVGDELEALAPEGEAFVEREADAFEKERVL